MNIENKKMSQDIWEGVYVSLSHCTFNKKFYQ